MKRQIKHMIKYKYLPFSWGKAKYQGKAPAKESKWFIDVQLRHQL